MTHLTAEQLSARLDGARTGAAGDVAERHLAECAQCRDALAELSRMDADLKTALEHDPGDAYFESFAARVEDRIRAAGLSGAQARLGGRWFGWMRSPRRLAWSGAAAAVVVGAGVVILASREVQRPQLSTAIVERSEQRDDGPVPLPEASLKSQQRSADEAGGTLAKGEGLAIESKDQARLEGAPGAAEEREVASVEATAERPAPTKRTTSTQRLQEVRRNAAGEDVPVTGQTYGFAQPPSTTGSATGDVQSGKPRAAAPLEAAPSQDERIAKSSNLAGSAETRLCGQVVDTQGRPVARAVVALVDRGRTATADAEGRFCLDAPEGVHQLSAMAVGYATSRLEVRLEGESSSTRLTLQPVSVLQSKSRALSDGDVNPLNRSDAIGGVTGQEARRLSARAESLGTAPAYDAAALAWQRVVSTVRGAAQVEARFRLAEARVLAWRLAATAARARAAKSALDAFLAVAPAGPQRDQAAQWRRQIR